MRAKKFLARLLALLCVSVSALAVLIILGPSSWVELLPYSSQIQSYFSLLVPYTQFVPVPAAYQIYLIPVSLLLSSLLFLLFQRAIRLWWTIPYLFVVYYTLFVLFRLNAGYTTPGAVLSALSTNPLIARILVWLALGLEGLIAFVLLYISFRFPSGTHSRRSKRSEVKGKGEGNDSTVETGTPVSAETGRKKPRKERKARTKNARKGENRRVTPSVSNTEAGATADAGSSEPEQKDSRLRFPSIDDVPDLPAVGVHKGQGVYVGKVNELPDASLVLTDLSTQTKDDGEEELQEPVAVSRKSSLSSLREKLEQENVTRDFTVPTQVRPVPFSQEVPISDPPSLKPDEMEEGSEGITSRMPENADSGQREGTAAPEEIAPSPENDDIDYISGVGGLVREGTSALLSRSKIGYTYPSPQLLDTYPNHSTEVDEATREAGQRLMETLRVFKIEAKIAHIVKGPTVTMYEVTLAPGVRISSIVNLSDNIAMELAAERVRIVAPIPGKQAVGIEVPNPQRSIIGFRDLLDTLDTHKPPHLPMILGRKITGEPVVVDLARTPHLLIAGATGSGKSVCVNALITSLLYLKSPKEVRLILVDPKIVELRMYNGIPHLLTPVITEPKKTIKALEFCLFEMERRYKLLNSLTVRNISAYNTKVETHRLAREKLPYIVLVIDEFADIMTTVGKELEISLARLAAMARAVGIHLVLATQRPSADVITGIIKSNIPTRIAFTVSGQTNSRIIIDENGAEKLLGQGDMLLAPGWEPNSTRIQGAFLSDEEVERVVAYVKTQGEPDYLDESFFEDEVEESDAADDDSDDDSDEALREKALRIIIERNGASASYLQRRLRIGYNKAARIIENLEEEGVVGPSRGSKPRELLRMPSE